MDEARLLTLLNRFNTWWDGDPVPTSLQKDEHRRRDFYAIRPRLQSGRQILMIRGPRQVGKTTLCGQLIDDLLTPPLEVPPERILYVTADNSQILSNPENVIRDSIEVFEQYVLEDAINNLEGSVFVFIDEIQKIDDWGSVLKYYVDTYANLQFVVTGSVSTLIKKDASETLVGRIEDRIVMPMKYVEHVRYKELLEEETIYEHSTQIRDALKNGVKTDYPAEFTEKLVGFYGKYEDAIPALNSCKDRYLLTGGYPGVLKDDLVDAYAKLDDDLRTTVTGDVATVYDVQKPQKMLQVLSLFMESTTGKLNVQNIADTTNLDRDTVERYMEYLKEFFLISRCPKYATSEYSAGGHPKVYLQDVGLYNTLAGTMAEDTLRDGEKMGPILETATFDHARRLQFYLSDTQSVEVAYWDKRGEVDFVLSNPEYALPIEVKNGDTTRSDLRGLRNFIDESSATFGLAVNNGGAFEVDGSVIHVPAWLFFFFC